MRFITKHFKRLRISFLKAAFIVIILNIIMIPQYEKFETDGDTMFKVYMNEEYVGTVGRQTDLEAMVLEARRQTASASDTPVMMEANLRTEGSEVIFGKLDSEKQVLANMVQVLNKNAHGGLVPAYTVKINTHTMNLASLDDVKEVLQAAANKYDPEGEYCVTLHRDPTRELNALTATLEKKEESQEKEVQIIKTAGIEKTFEGAFEEAEEEGREESFEEFEYGLMELAYGNSIEIVDSYLQDDRIMSVEQAIADITSEHEKNVVYEVQAGDTLSGISMSTDIPIDKLVSMNEALEDENSTIRIGQELLISSPEPPLSINRVEQEYIEEDYDAEVIYVDNDDWYTTDHVTLQEPSAGHRNIVAQISYHNDKEVGREVIKEEVILEAVPKIVERGTKIPPTYIKPISGGRLSSTFGGRKAPTKGASSNHQGVDWAVAKGTAVVASSGGVVTKAGWAKGYGYVVYIKHPDGKETRYGHLSKVLVSVGQNVKQGEKIALSGNSGVSTGPHLHFEIRINGTAVNPLKYLN